KLTSDLGGSGGLYLSTVNSSSAGGELFELHYAQGWVYAVGSWKGTATNSQIGLADVSFGGTEDVEIIKLDTDLLAKGRATVKGIADNRGYAVTSDEEGNVYLTGTFGSGSVDFVGDGDRDSMDPAHDRKFTSLSSAKANLFVAKLNPDMDYEWIRAPRIAPDSFS